MYRKASSLREEMINEALYRKMSLEQDRFRERLLRMQPEDIVMLAGEYAVRQDLLCTMENTHLSCEKCVALLKSNTPLEDVYRAFERSDMSHYNEFLSDLIYFCAEEREVY